MRQEMPVTASSIILKLKGEKKNISEEIFNHIVATNGYSADEIEVVKKFWSAPLTGAAVMF